MLVDLIRSRQTDPQCFIRYLKNENQIYGIINQHYTKTKNYYSTANIIKSCILDEKIKSLKKYRNIIKDIYKHIPKDNEILYLHCLIDCGLHQDCLSFLESTNDHKFKQFLYCFYYLQTKNYDSLIKVFLENISSEYIVAPFLPSIINDLSQKNSLEYVQIIHKLYHLRDLFTKETQDLISNIRFSYLHNKNVSVVVACMNRLENLLKILPSWINVPYVKDIVIVDYSSSKPISEDLFIKSLCDKELVRIIRVDGETKFNLGKAYNIGFDHCKYNTILKIDSDYVCLDHAWLDILYKSNSSIDNLLLRGSYSFSNELSGFFLVDKSKLVYFREDLNGYGYDEIDLYNRTKLLYPKINEIVWFDIENSIKHLHHNDKLRTNNYISNNIKQTEFENRELCNKYSPATASRNSYTKNKNVIFNKHSINRIFCINLKERLDRWESLKDIPNIERFDAIKSKDCSDFDLQLNPADLSSKLYFKLHPGAMGCYLSHYTLWNKIVDENIEYALILEDDVEIDSIKKLLLSNLIIENHEFINLSKRFRYENERYLFDGGESYILSLSGAKKLINITHNPILLNNISIEKFASVKDAIAQMNITDEIVLKSNSIICALDKFMGYCCEKVLDVKIRLSSYIYPIVDINTLTSRLSNINNKDTNAWDLSQQELLTLL